MLQLVFGWPGIITFIAIATLAAWGCSAKLMLVALVLSLPSSLYLFGGNGWIQLVAVYIPTSLLMCALLLKRGKAILPRVMLLPIYVFHAWLGAAVYNQ